MCQLPFRSVLRIYEDILCQEGGCRPQARLEPETETYLKQALCAETELAEHAHVAGNVELRAYRCDMEGKITLRIVVVVVRLHIADVGADAHVGVELDEACAIVFIAAVEHYYVVGDVACVGAALGGAGRKRVRRANPQPRHHAEVQTGRDGAPCRVDVVPIVVHVHAVHLSVAAVAELELGALSLGPGGDAEDEGKNK